MPSNAYSRRWHEAFSLHGLREPGYEVVGVERDPAVAAWSRSTATGRFSTWVVRAAT